MVVGYSFRDSHVNEIVSRWFNDTPGRRIVLLSRSRSRGHEEAPLLQQLERLCAGLAAEASFPFIRVEATAAVGLSEAISRERDRTTVDSPS